MVPAASFTSVFPPSPPLPSLILLPLHYGACPSAAAASAAAAVLFCFVLFCFLRACLPAFVRACVRVFRASLFFLGGWGLAGWGRADADVCPNGGRRSAGLRSGEGAPDGGLVGDGVVHHGRRRPAALSRAAVLLPRAAPQRRHARPERDEQGQFYFILYICVFLSPARASERQIVYTYVRAVEVLFVCLLHV